MRVSSLVVFVRLVLILYRMPLSLSRMAFRGVLIKLVGTPIRSPSCEGLCLFS